MANRQFVTINHNKLSYVDFGGNGAPLLTLHGHCGCANSFAQFAGQIKDQYRVINLDQRGHGWSDHPGIYTREAYIDDLYGIIRHLELSNPIVLGHSLGGVNTYQFAAKYPGIVKAMIIEDIGTTVDLDFSFINSWPGKFPSLLAMKNFLVENDVGDYLYFLESAVEEFDGWRFRFDLEHIPKSQESLNGNWMNDWTATSCPALLLHGQESWVMTAELAREMVANRANTSLVEFPNCSHVIHDDDPIGFYNAVGKFLLSIE